MRYPVPISGGVRANPPATKRNMKTTTKSAIAAIRRQLGVARLDPRRLYLVDDGAYRWIGDRAGLTADLARKIAFANRDGRRPDLVTQRERDEADARWGADWYSLACNSARCVAASHGSAGRADWDALPESWRDGSALGPIAPL